ncbi:cytochrome c [Candidatus Binatia bacterium]|nr:cytochrome c [Candidatus Binatia bacterium]
MRGLALLGLFSVALGTFTPVRAAEEPPIYKKKCFLCHSIGGVGGKKQDKGGKLDGVATKRGEEWIRAYLEKPKSKIPDSKMKKINMSPEDEEALMKFLMSLK